MMLWWLQIDFILQLLNTIIFTISLHLLLIVNEENEYRIGYIYIYKFDCEKKSKKKDGIVKKQRRRRKDGIVKKKDKKGRYMIHI